MSGCARQSTPAQKMPVGNAVGDDDFLKGVCHLQNLLPGKALLDTGKKTVIDILANAAQTFAMVTFIERYIAPQPQRRQ